MKGQLALGMSLLEMMLVLVLGGVIASLSLSGWRPVVVRHPVENTLRLLTSTLHYAFEIARVRGQAVTVCALRTDRLKEIQGCQRGAPGWQAGVLVFESQSGQPVDQYASGHALRHSLFDARVRVENPERVFRILPNGQLIPRGVQRFQVTNVSSAHDAACAVLTAGGKVTLCRARPCTQC